MSGRPSDVVLAHYGVKGMKWGKRKAQTESNTTKRLSRKEVRQLNKQGQREFDQKKAKTLLETAVKNGDKVLIKVATPGQYPTVATGKEFADYAAKGGVFDIRMTEVYAIQKGDVYELAGPSEKYQKIKR